MLILILFKIMNKKESIKKYYYDVIPSYNIKGTLLYHSDIKYEVGCIVRISLRKKEVLGCIVNLLKQSPNINFRVKNILEQNYSYKFNKNTIDFLYWVSKYNLCNLGLVLKLIISNDKFLELKAKIFLAENNNYIYKLTGKQKEFINYLSENYLSYKDIVKESIYKKSFIDNLVKKNIIYKKHQLNKEFFKLDLRRIKLNKLNLYQEQAFKKILKLVKDKKTKPIYFDGITGSGKT